MFITDTLVNYFICLYSAHLVNVTFDTDATFHKLIYLFTNGIFGKLIYAYKWHIW